MNPVFFAPFIGSLVRHGLTAAGGFLVAKGIATPETVQGAAGSLSEIAVGGVVFLGGFIPSLLKGKKAK
jgi:hypothetical protein